MTTVDVVSVELLKKDLTRRKLVIDFSSLVDTSQFCYNHLSAAPITRAPRNVPSFIPQANPSYTPQADPSYTLQAVMIVNRG